MVSRPEKTKFLEAYRTKGQKCGLCGAAAHRASHHEELHKARVAQAVAKARNGTWGRANVTEEAQVAGGPTPEMAAPQSRPGGPLAPKDACYQFWKHKSCNTMGIFLDYYDEKMERARAEDAEVAVFSYTGASWAVGPLVDRRS